MGTFLICLAGSAVVLYALLMLFGVALGEAGAVIVCLLAVGAIFALFACVLERLTRVEEKLDELLREKYKDYNGK